MSIGAEDIKLAPIQDAFFIRMSHDSLGNRLLGDPDYYPYCNFPLLAAGGTYNSDAFETDGYREFDILVLSNAIGTLYVHQGVDPLRVRNEVVADRWTFYPYVAVNRPNTFLVPVRSRYARVVFVNGATVQTVWEFSIQLRPY